MKNDRQAKILEMICQNGTVTAPRLAEKFGVSRRTIQRDIEALQKSGVPIFTKQGIGGGISVSPDYTPAPRAQSENAPALSDDMTPFPETEPYTAVAVYEPSAKSRLILARGENSFTVQKDGTLYAAWRFSSEEEAVRWLLSFGADVLVTSPPKTVKKMRSVIKKMKKRYKT